MNKVTIDSVNDALIKFCNFNKKIFFIKMWQLISSIEACCLLSRSSYCTQRVKSFKGPFTRHGNGAVKWVTLLPMRPLTRGGTDTGAVDSIVAIDNMLLSLGSVPVSKWCGQHQCRGRRRRRFV